jgi:hypothetical protein
VRFIGVADEAAQRIAEPRPGRFPFFDQRLERRLAHDREDNVAYDAVGLRERCVGEREEYVRPAGNAFRIVEECLTNAAIGLRVDAMDGIHEQICEVSVMARPRKNANAASQVSRIASA